MPSAKLAFFINTIDRVSEWSGRIFSLLVVPLTLLIVFEVITRRFFNRPTIWTFELSNFLYGAHFMLCAAYGLLHKSHVSIDIFSSHLSPKSQDIIAIACYLLMFFPFVLGLFLYGVDYAWQSWTMRETSWSIWGPVLYPAKAVIPVTALLMLLQGFGDVLKKILSLSREVQP